MIRDSLRNAAYAVAPRYARERYLQHKMISQAERLNQLRDSSADPSVLIETLWNSHFFRPLQKKSEIFRLLDRIRSLQADRICEIGAAGGGTTFLLAGAARKNATIITLDLAFNESRQAAVSSFALSGQKIFCLQGDSHNPETLRVVTNCLGGRSLDVLYLDGDHRYEGIKADFELFSPLVRTGGLIVFHDIVPDYKTRYGIETSSYVGGVPQFWEEIKADYSEVEEIVEDAAQDGYGIGVLDWSGAAEVSSSLCSPPR